MQKNIPSGMKKPSLPVRVMKWTLFQMVSLVLAVILLTVGYAAVTWTNIPSGSGASGQPVNQTLVQGIINNMNNLNERLKAINPAGTTLSGSSVCIGGDCKNSWESLGGMQTIASYANAHAGTYTCSMSKVGLLKESYLVSAIITGTTMRVIFKNSDNNTIYCDSGDVSFSSFVQSARCDSGDVIHAGVGCSYGATGVACQVSGSTSYGLGTNGSCLTRF